MSTKRVTTRPYPDLRTWRRAEQLNQRDAAKMLRISQAYYSRLERKVQPATGKRAKWIMAQTGVPVEVLVGAA